MSRVVLTESLQEEIDHATGEIRKEMRRGAYRFETEPAYIKLYLEDLLMLSDGMKSYSKVLLYLMRNCSFASDEYGMCVQLATGVKKMMMDKIGYKKMQSIDNALQGLMKCKILKRVAPSVYMLNPRFFGRGDWRDISRLRMTVDYDNTGKKINTFVSYEGGKKENE